MPDDVILGKAAVIDRCLCRVREEYTYGPDALMDQTRQDAIVLNLLRACEACIDLAMHVVRVRRLGLPETSRAAFELLHGAGLLDERLTGRMKAMVGETLINPLRGLISDKALRAHFDFSLYRHALPCAWTVPRPSLAAGKP